MINRKIVWLSILVFTVILGACSGDEEAELEHNELNALYNHKVHKVLHFALDDRTEGLKIDEENSAPPIGEFETMHMMGEDTGYLNEQSASFIEKLSAAQEDVADIWNDDFHQLYQTYRNEQAYIIENEQLSLNEAQIEEVAIQIERLHTQYAALEQNLHDLEVPQSVAENSISTVQDVIDEISMAIENRTLALIEFKSIYQSEDYEKHDELLSIHVGNSDKYLTRADETINELASEVDEE